MGEHECKCCKEGLGSAIEWEFRMIEKYGWYSHFVFDEPCGLGNSHTHGLADKYGHPDLQIVVPLPPVVAGGIFWAVVRRIEAGEKFEPGKRYDRVLEGLDVMFTPAVECGRDVLRVVLPDKHGNLTVDELQDLWKLQWTAPDLELLNKEARRKGAGNGADRDRRAVKRRAHPAKDAGRPHARRHRGGREDGEGT